MATTTRPTTPSPGRPQNEPGSVPGKENLVIKTYRWLDERLGIEGVVRATALHPVPRTVNWWYVFGSAALTAFMIQVITGTFLAFSYIPSPDHAYQSLDYITHHQLLGNVLRGIHYWGASAMVLMVVVHMTAHFLTGSYKYPRELQWLTGVLLLFATILMAFTGQLLRWNQDAYWALVVGAEQAARTPIIGPIVAQVLTAGPAVNGQTLSRIYAVHMLLIPGAIFALIGVHLYLVIYKGISEWPVPGRPVDPKTYWAEYQEILHTNGEPFFPVSMWKDALMAMAIILTIGGLAIFVGAEHLGFPADPTKAPETIRPDWYLIWLFAILALVPPKSTDWVILGLPGIAFLIMVAIPLANKGERHYSRRPWALATSVLLLFGLTILVIVGYKEPWKPLWLVDRSHTHAYIEALPASYLKGLNPTQKYGANLMHQYACFGCHQIGPIGGQRGPNLTHAGDTLSQSEIITRITYGGNNMPQFGTKLSPKKLNAIVQYLLSRTSPGHRQSNIGSGP